MVWALVPHARLVNTHYLQTLSRPLSSMSLADVLGALPDASSNVVSGLTWLPSSTLCHALHSIEYYTGLPLYAGIGLSCITVRLCTVPLLIMQQRQTALLASYLPQLQYFRYLFLQDREMPFTERLATYRKAVRLIKKRSGYSRLKAWSYLFVQTPLFICFVLSLRQALTSDTAMTHGGTLWFLDLTSKDSTLVLPAAALGLTYYTLEMALGRRKVTETDAERTKSRPLFLRVVSWYQTALILSFPLITQMPSGVFVYWIHSSLWTIAQSKALTIPAVRNWIEYNSSLENMKTSNISIPTRASAKQSR